MVEKKKFMKPNKLKTKIIGTKINKKNISQNYSKTRKKTKQIGDVNTKNLRKTTKKILNKKVIKMFFQRKKKQKQKKFQKMFFKTISKNF